MYTYTYDKQGNLDEVWTDQATPVKVSEYSYHPTGLLNQATYSVPGGTRTVTNTWDADSNRVRFFTTSEAHTFIYEITAATPAVIKEDSTYYLREPDGALIARVCESHLSYYHFDSLGSTRLLTDVNGDVTDKYAFDAYGALLVHDRFAGSVDQPYQYVGKLGYYTHWQEPELKLLQLGIRFYGAELGTFTQMDRFKQSGLSSYSYSGASPLTWIDPDGLKKIKYPYPVPPGNVARFKICCRDLFGCGGKLLSIRHAYLLIGGKAVGYGPENGAESPIAGDKEDIVNGRANCTEIGVSNAAYAKLNEMLKDPQGIPGNWGPGSWPDGPYFPISHDCYDWARAAMKYAGLDPSLITDVCDKGTFKAHYAPSGIGLGF